MKPLRPLRGLCIFCNVNHILEKCSELTVDQNTRWRQVKRQVKPREK